MATLVRLSRAARFSTRGMSAAAAKELEQEFQVSTLPNGVTVATHPTHKAVNQLAVVVNAGSRHETTTNAGVSQVLRTMAFKSTEKATEFKITRSMEALGVQLSATSTREYTVYQAEFLPSTTNEVVGTVIDAVAAPEYLSWELSRAKSSAKQEAKAESQNPASVIINDLHIGAFRRGLGNSFIPDQSQIDNIDIGTLESFKNKQYGGSGIVVVGQGISHDALLGLCSGLGSLASDSASPSQSKYHGGSEIRHNNCIGATYVGFGFEGAKNGPDALPFLVLKHILGGNGSSIKYASAASSSPVGAAVAQAVKGGFSLAGFNAGYADTGLLGVTAKFTPSDAPAGISAAHKSITSVLSGNFSEDDFNRAKNQLRMQILSSTGLSQATNVGIQLHVTKDYTCSFETAEKLDKLSLDDVKKAAAVAKKSKATFVVRGDIGDVPFYDEL